MYTIREKLAYSNAGKAVATLIRNVFFPSTRVHWVQQSMADMSFAKL